MKTPIRFIFILAFATFSFHAKAQQVIASSGGYIQNGNLSVSFTIGEPVIETFQNDEITLTQGFQQPYSFYFTQLLNIPVGWSGVSSYIDPLNKGVGGIFSAYENDFVILASMSEFYYPAAGVNTIGNWNYQNGYQIKTSNDLEITMAGSKIGNPTLELAEGWNLIPVLSSENVDAAALFSAIDLVLAKEVAGSKVFWPQFNIQTLDVLNPGKAYFALLSSPGSISFSPNNTKTGATPNSEIPMPDSPWGKIQATGSSHLIAVPAELAAGFSEGDVIGLFNSDDICAGFETIVHNNQNFAITAYADDPTTAEKDGFEVGETFVVKIFKPKSGLEYTLQAEFDPNLPQSGYFADNGISAIKSFNTTGVNEFGDDQIDVSVYPNPSADIFNIHFKNQSGVVNWEVTDMHGSLIVLGNDQFNDFTIDISSHPKGIYYLKITKGGLQMVRKLVLQ